MFMRLKCIVNIFIELLLEKITKDDILNVVKRLLSSQPSVAARGDLRKMPSLDYVQAGLLDNAGKISKGNKLSLFR